MNVDSVGKIRPPKPGEGQVSLLITDNKRVHAKQGGVSHSFHLLYKPDSTNQDIFAKAVQPLLDLFIAGFNTCIIIYGESGSGKSYTMAGEQGPNAQPGLVPHSINYVMSELQNKSLGLRDSIEDPQISGRMDGDVFRLLLYQFEIYNEVITDLMANRGGISARARHPMELEHSAAEGTYIKNLHYEKCRTPAEALSAFWQSWQARNTNIVDFGPVQNFSTVVFQMDLTMMTNENPMPNRSKFTVIRMPGMEKLSEDLSRTRLREGPTLSKSIIAFNQLSADLARQQEPERVVNYGESKLTSLLKDILGGDCKTRVICCLPPNNNNPDVMAAVLTGCGLLTEVRNYPILNDSLAQNLITQYRSRIDASLQHGGFDVGGKGAGMLSRSELQDQLLKITTDNTQLRERNDRLFQRLEQVQEKLTDLAKSKSELSSKLVASEEEKLKVSKGLVELQLENNRLTEEYEAENFELKNKILALENQLVEFELEKDKYARDHNVTAQHTKHLEDSRKQIAEEFVQLKQKTIDLQTQYDRQLKRNDEMRVELAKLIDTEAALLDLRHNVDKQREVEGAAKKELERAKTLLHSSDTDNDRGQFRNRNKEKDVATEVREMREQRHGGTVKRNTQPNNKLGPTDTGRDLLENYRLISMDDDVVKNMKSLYDEQTAKLEKSLLQLRSQLSAAYETVQAANKKCSEHSSALTTAQDGFKRAKQENIQLQQQIKESNQDYRKRMWKYVQDIAEFMDDNKGEKSTSRMRDSMKKYVDGMMKEMRSAFRSREEQLSNTARNNRKLAKSVISQHERLLISYRSLREQLESIKIATGRQSDQAEAGSVQIVPVVQYPINLGPDESTLLIDEKELQSALSIELNQLRQAMQKTKSELKATRLELERMKSRDKLPPPHTLRDIFPNKGLNNALPDINRNMQEYTRKTQAELEKERAELLTRATVAEQQIAEQHEYINSHLARYKQELLRLRKMLADKGIDAGRSSPDPLLYTQRYGGKLLDPLTHKS